MSQKQILDDFQNVKSLVGSPDLSKPQEKDQELFNFKDKIEKPYLSEEAKVLLAELQKYKTVYAKKEDKKPENQQKNNYISEKAQKILEDLKLSQKNIDTQTLTNQEKTSDINSNFYSLTEPFTFEARDFSNTNESPQKYEKIPISPENDMNLLKNKYNKDESTPVKLKKNANPAFHDDKNNEKKEFKVFEVDLNKGVSKNNEKETNIKVIPIKKAHEESIKPQLKIEEINNHFSNTNKPSQKDIKIDSLFNLNTPIESNKFWSEQPRSLNSMASNPSNISSSNKNELKIKGFQMQVDNIINNCFSNFIHRSFSNGSPTRINPANSKIQRENFNYSRGFFSSEEKNRILPLSDSIGKEMDQILKKIKGEIAQKTEQYTKNYQGDYELRKSRFITEIQQAVKSSLEELDQIPGASSNRKAEPKSLQTNIETPRELRVKSIKINNDTEIHSLKNDNLNSSVDKGFIEEIVKKTTNEMVLSLMKSNLLETNSAKTRPIQDLSKSVEELPSALQQKEASFLTNNFQKKKAEILSQIENLDKEILQMEKHDDDNDEENNQENTYNMNKSIEDTVKNSFLSSPLDLPDPYFKPRIKVRKPEVKEKNLAKTQSISHVRVSSNNKYRSPGNFSTSAPKEKFLIPKTTESARSEKKPFSKSFNTNNVNNASNINNANNVNNASGSQKKALKTFEERNRKWLQEREMKLQKSKDKMEGVLKECTFKPLILDKKRWNPSKDRTLTSVASPQKKPLTTPVKKPIRPQKSVTVIKKAETLVKAIESQTRKPLKEILKPNVKPALEKKTNILERRALQTEKKPTVPTAKPKIIPRAASVLAHKGLKTTNSQPATTLKQAVMARTTSNPSVFKPQNNRNRENLQVKTKTISRAIAEKTSPSKSNNKSNRNETSIEEIFKNKKKNSKEQGEMKELIGVLINLTKTLKEKKNSGEESEKTIDPPFELNVKTVKENEIEKENKTTNLAYKKFEGYEEIEPVVIDRALTEKVLQTISKDEDEDDDILQKTYNFDKFSGILNKATYITEQIKRALNTAPTINGSS